MTIATPGRTRAAPAWGRLATALGVVAVGALSACGPGVATPIPEPPTFKIGRIGPPDRESVTATPDGGRHIHGLSGAAPPGALLRVTNLDRADPVVVSNVGADGAFDLNIVVNQGDEVRFAWSRGSERGAPEDARFVPEQASYHFESSPRFACLKFVPGLALDFGEVTEQSLRVQNECAFDVSIATPRTRLGLTDFALQSPLPLEIPARGVAELGIAFSRTQPGAREDTLFVDLAGNEQQIRYPVTLLAPAQ